MNNNQISKIRNQNMTSNLISLIVLQIRLRNQFRSEETIEVIEEVAEVAIEVIRIEAEEEVEAVETITTQEMTMAMMTINFHEKITITINKVMIAKSKVTNSKIQMIQISTKARTIGKERKRIHFLTILKRDKMIIIREEGEEVEAIEDSKENSLVEEITIDPKQQDVEIEELAKKSETRKPLVRCLPRTLNSVMKPSTRPRNLPMIKAIRRKVMEFLEKV